MINKICKNCIFWIKGDEGFVDNDKYRDCKMMLRYNNNKEIDIVIYDSGDDYDLICKTGKNFGCIHFKENIND